MATLYSKAIELLEDKTSFAYVTIISQSGSTPRSAGSNMLVLPHEIYETIGGGGVEADIIELARQEVLVTHRPLLMNYQLDAKKAAASDFICGGVCEILIAFIDAEDQHNLEVMKAAHDAQRNGESSWLCYTLSKCDDGSLSFQMDICFADPGVLDSRRSSSSAQSQSDSVDKVRCIFDAIHTNGTIFLFGAGHVSREVALLATRLEFNVVVIDDRIEFANQERFPECNICVIDSFDNLPEFVIDSNSYIIILTRGHMHDKAVFEWALHQKPFYLGMIGSATKREIIYRELKQKGFSREQLSVVKCPIGLPVGAETPAEIAISIISEVLMVKNSKH